MRLSIKNLIVGGIALGFFACQPKDRFRVVPPSASNIEFVNEIVDSDSFNILTFEYIYNGGGVAIADFDNDGQSDIFFTGNMVPNRLYLNRGDLEFEDVTEDANVGAADKWCSGVAVVDINLDGWKDIYIAVTTNPEAELRRNILYLNKGLNDSGIPTFKNEASDYGIDDSSHTVNSAFLDYDQDGDLDLFIAINKMEDSKTPNVYRDRENPAEERVDKLFENRWSEESGHPVFVDVSKEAGIVYEGYSLGVNATDINQDGLVDIYVTNDYLSRDIIYINNADGTFTNKTDDFFQHTSYSAMGNDVVDINNDGRPDVVALDMLPEDNYRRKTMLMNNNYTNYINNERYDYQYQYTRNTFQLNQGNDPVTGEPVFGDYAFMAGVSSTDWSWTPVVADFDNDGFRDMIITNGFPKDVTDRDFVDYNTEFSRLAKKSTLLSKIPSVKIKNYAYRNVDGVHFEDVTAQWGIQYPSFSNGAAYGDLDNDGDLDYVINNINDPAFLFENLTSDKDENNNWLRLKLIGSEKNPAAIGTKIHLFAGGNQVFWEHSVYRGYLSSVEEIVHFGLAEASVIDSLLVIWPDGATQSLYGVTSNQVLELNKNASSPSMQSAKNKPGTLFQDVSGLISRNYLHNERDIIDFNIQPLLPHKLSQYGPGVAVADINEDGLEDVYLGGSHFEKGTFLIQQSDGSFLSEDRFSQDDSLDHEDMGCLFFDADGDGDQDLYVVSGSNEAPAGDLFYRDRLYVNENGKFELSQAALPDMLISGSCVRAADFDQDGDLDLFIGGRLVPFKYPKPTSSYILLNESTDQEVSFNLAHEKAPFLKDLGMVSDALWTDFDNDGWIDLIVAGEWMPIRFFKNTKGEYVDVTNQSGIQDKIGWWNSLVSGDFDQDGDIDYIAGNHGTNSLFKASDSYPVGIYGADFDGNNGFDMVPTVFLEDYQGRMQEVPYFGRGDMIKQINKIRAQFKRYADFGQASIDDVFSPAQLDSALIYKANYMQTSYIENEGNGKFSISPLPVTCQAAPVYGMISEDVDGDGIFDILMVGNDFGAEVLQGRMDALKGVYLKGNGDGTFNVGNMIESGFYVPGDAKALTYLFDKEGRFNVIATQNRDSLRAFRLIKPIARRTLALEPEDYLVQIKLANGQEITREVYYGHSFLSQSSRSILIPENTQSIEVTKFNGASRIVERSAN